MLMSKTLGTLADVKALCSDTAEAQGNALSDTNASDTNVIFLSVTISAMKMSQVIYVTWIPEKENEMLHQGLIL